MTDDRLTTLERRVLNLADRIELLAARFDAHRMKVNADLVYIIGELHPHNGDNAEHVRQQFDLDTISTPALRAELSRRRSGKDQVHLIGTPDWALHKEMRRRLDIQALSRTAGRP